MLTFIKQLFCSHVEKTEMLHKNIATKRYHDEGTCGHGNLYNVSIVKDTCVKCNKVTIRYEYERV